jgi:superfamily II DNA or RNA helicase
MRIVYDRGTLLLLDPGGALGAGTLPGALWDPRIRAFRAPAWRHAELVAALERRRIAYEDAARDAAAPAPQRFGEIDLRPYQHAALDAWSGAGERGIVVLPTGAGKTRVALGAMAATGARTLCLVPTRALLHQWRAEVARTYPGPIGCWGDGRHVTEAIAIATFESAWRYMHRLGRCYELLVIDEVHHFGRGVRDEALELSIAPRRLGLTATPPDEPALARVSELVGPIVAQLGVADLAGKWLADFDLIVLRLGLDAAERRSYDADTRVFQDVHRRFRRLAPHASWDDFVRVAMASSEGREAVAAWLRARRLLSLTAAKRAVLRELLARHRAGRVLVFTADNDAAYAIAREHLLMPITCDIGRREREAALSAFKRGELRALVSARVLNEGIDVPDADVAIVVSGSHGQREHVQRIGRLLRPVPGKRALVYELVTRDTSEVRRSIERRRGLDARAAPVV